jgi:hypothetical protein
MSDFTKGLIIGGLIAIIGENIGLAIIHGWI